MVRTLKSLLCGAVALAIGAHAAPSCSASNSPRTFEAENAVLSGTTIDTAQTGYTGECELLHAEKAIVHLR